MLSKTLFWLPKRSKAQKERKGEEKRKGKGKEKEKGKDKTHTQQIKNMCTDYHKHWNIM